MSSTRSLFTASASLAAVLMLVAAGPADARRGRGGDDSDDDDRHHDGRHHDDAWDDHGGHGRRGHHHEHHGVRWDDGRHSGHRDGWWLAFDGPRFEIESHVVAVHPLERVLILETGEALAVPAETRFHPDGDVYGFDSLARAVEAGVAVEIEGFAGPPGDDVFVAVALKVEIDD